MTRKRLAGRAAVRAIGVLVPVLAAEGPLRAGLPQHVVLHRRQGLPPLGLGVRDRSLARGCGVILHDPMMLRGYPPAVLILGIIAFGVIAGWVARTILGRSDLSWGRTILYGLIGSFVGGLVLSLLFGDGLALRPSGIIGSILGAMLLILGDTIIRGRRSANR